MTDVPRPQKATKKYSTPSLVAAAESFARIGKIAWYAVGVIVAVFAGGVAAQEYRAGLVDEGFLEKRLVPVELQVRSNTEEIARRTRIVEAVDRLIERDIQNQDRDRVRRKLAVFDREYSQSLAEYSADRAAGKPATRPRKSPAHLEQEALNQEFDE